MQGQDRERESLESLFRRWRDGEDDEALGEVLARTEDELLALARRQARDESAADDLVQATWITLLRDARRWDDRQRLMPWLVGILQIEARRARRAAARAPDPERVHVGEPARTDALAVASEIRDLVGRAVAALPDLYGEVVRLHVLQGLSHQEIAARTGRAPGTVRVQVFRGLAQLRQLLPASLSLGAALAVLAPRSEAARIATILEHASSTSTAAPTVDASTAAGAGAGGLVAGLGAGWILAAAAVVLACAAAWVAFAGGRRAPEPLARGTARVEQAADGAFARARNDELEAASGLPARRAGGAPTTSGDALAPGARLVLRIDGLARLPRAGATLTLRRIGETPWEIQVDDWEHLEIDLQRWYGPQGAAPREFVVEYDHPHALPVRTPILLDEEGRAAARAAASSAGVRSAIEVRVALTAPAARVHGRAVRVAETRANGRVTPVVAALFEIDDAGVPSSDPVEARILPDDRTFELRAARTGRHALLLLPVPQAGRPATVLFDLARGERHDVGSVDLTRGFGIAGVVLRAPGERPDGLAPIVRWRRAGAEPVLSARGVPAVWTGARFEHARGAVTVTPDGAFAIDGLAPGDHEIESGYRAHDPVLPDPVLPDPVPLDLEPEFARALRIAAPASGVVLEGPGSLTFVDVRGDGAALALAEVEYEQAGERRRARTDEHGRALFAGLGAGRLLVRHAGFAAFERAFPGDPPARIEVDLARAVDRGQVVLAARGVDWSQAVCVLVPAEAVDLEGLAALRRGERPAGVDPTRIDVEGDGRLAIDLPAGRSWLRVMARRDALEGVLAHARPYVTEVEVRAGSTTRVDVELELWGRIRFAPVAARADAEHVGLDLHLADGRPVPLEIASLVLRGDARQGRVSARDRLPFGAHGTSGLVEPGTYGLRATIGPRSVERTLVVEAGRTSVVALDEP